MTFQLETYLISIIQLPSLKSNRLDLFLLRIQAAIHLALQMLKNIDYFVLINQSNALKYQ